MIGARDLRNADWVGKSDPYCICETLGKETSRIETEVVDDCLNPKWNLEAQVINYKIEDALKFTVKDKDPLKPDDILGTVTLPSESFLGAGFDGELQLTQTTNDIPSFLKIRVEVGDKVKPEESDQ